MQLIKRLENALAELITRFRLAVYGHPPRRRQPLPVRVSVPARQAHNPDRHPLWPNTPW